MVIMVNNNNRQGLDKTLYVHAHYRYIHADLQNVYPYLLTLFSAYAYMSQYNIFSD